jgi:2-hydroxycyclohexanecarboxyl-CoA dehydrogenase
MRRSTSPLRTSGISPAFGKEPSMLRVDGLEGRVAVVTGAGRGIGRRVAEVLHENGARVAGFDLEPPSFSEVLGLRCDVTDEEEVDTAFTRVESELGPVSVLVLNAGIYPIVPFEETSLDLWKRTIDVNLTGAFICAKRALPGMRAMGYGRVVAMGSSAGKAGGARSIAAYAASKAGLMTLAKSIANEYASYGVTSNALAPALIDTEMIASTRDLLPRIPVGRFGTADEVAALVAFLCSSHAGYITGEVTDINGGFLID